MTDNYRAIAINSSLCKIFDYMIIEFYENLFVSEVNNRQFAYKAKCSTSQCTFILSEVVDYYIKNGSSVVASFIDCSKAFDRVQYKRLFCVLQNKGICPITCRLLAVMYSNIKANVVWNGIVSDVFDINNGVKQGGVISPLLFNLYTESLISEIIESGIGCHIGSVSTAVLMYADDIALLAPTRSAMQRLLDICQRFGLEHNLSFNPEKSECIIFGSKYSNLDLYLNNKLIPIVNEVTYLGHKLFNSKRYSNDIFCIDSVISDLKTRTNIILSHFKFLDIDSKIKIFNTNCSSFYGCILSNQENNSLDSLDRAWRVACRRILSLPYRTHCNLIPPLMNSLPPSKQINIRTINFFKNSLNSNSNFLKFICNNCLNEESSTMFKSLNKISCNLKLNISDLLQLPKSYLKKEIIVNFNWKSCLLKELLHCREGKMDCGLSFNMINQLITDICLF